MSNVNQLSKICYLIHLHLLKSYSEHLQGSCEISTFYRISVLTLSVPIPDKVKKLS